MRHEYASLKILLEKPSEKNHCQGKEYNSCAILQLHKYLIKTFGQENHVGQKLDEGRRVQFYTSSLSLMSTILSNGAYQLGKDLVNKSTRLSLEKI